MSLSQGVDNYLDIGGGGGGAEESVYSTKLQENGLLSISFFSPFLFLSQSVSHIIAAPFVKHLEVL